MDKIVFEELKPLLKYDEMTVGETVLRKRTRVVSGQSLLKTVYEGYQLLHKDTQWMFIDMTTAAELKQQFIEYNLAKGVVVTTGLGLGLLQTSLACKQSVDHVIVFEKNPDVVTMFKHFVATSDFDDSKIEIVNADASEAVSVKCDWLLMDHFECFHQTHWEIVDQVREIGNNCKAGQIFFWPLPKFLRDYSWLKNQILDNYSYGNFRDSIKLHKLPQRLDERVFPLINKLKWD